MLCEEIQKVNDVFLHNWILHQRKVYYGTNREKILQKKREKIMCECGSAVRRDYMIEHKRTKKHIAFVEN